MTTYRHIAKLLKPRKMHTHTLLAITTQKRRIMRLSLYSDLFTDNPPDPDWKVGHPTRVYLPYSFRIVVGVLLSPTRTIQLKVLWDWSYGLRSLSEKTRKANLLHMSLQRRNFLVRPLVSVWPWFQWTCDFPLSIPALSRLSYQGGSKATMFHQYFHCLPRNPTECWKDL